MDPKPRTALPINRSGALLFIGLVIAAFAAALINAPSLFTPLKTVLLLAGGILYALLGIFGSAYCKQLNSAKMTALYFAIQIALVAALSFYFGIGTVWLLPLPLVGQSIEFLPRRWPIIVVLIVVVTVGPMALNTSQLTSYYHQVIYQFSRGGYSQLLGQAVFQYLLAIAFVIVFTQVAARESQARTEVQRLADELGKANQQLREYAVQVEDLATVKERNRLAREIHDSLGHYLTVINVQLEAARVVLKEDPQRTLDALGKAQALTQDGLADVRRSVAALRASPENRPLPDAIPALVNEFRASGTEAVFTLRGEPRPLSPQAELTLYRAAQEGLTNTRKYAHATHLQVTLDYSTPDKIRLTVEDDGQGSAEAGGGFGLLGLRERTALLGGQVNVRTEPGKGFRLEVELPG